MQIALKYIKLVMDGENGELEYGGSTSSLKAHTGFSLTDILTIGK